jgi:hypothetical protein
MRKQTKAQIILAEAKARVDKAQMDLDSHQKQLEMALAVLQAHRTAFYDLERSLAPKPRSNGKSQPAAPRAGKKSSSQKSLNEASVANTKVETENATHAFSYGEDANTLR